MAISKLFFIYLSSLAAFLLIDLVWLGVVAKGTYQKYLGSFLAPQPQWVSAIIFYVLFVVGIMIFAILPALKEGSLTRALIYGALFGFFTYATYELTNHAVMKDWPLGIVFIDILWGMILTLCVAGVGYYVGTLLS